MRGMSLSKQREAKNIKKIYAEPTKHALPQGWKFLFPLPEMLSPWLSLWLTPSLSLQVPYSNIPAEKPFPTMQGQWHSHGPLYSLLHAPPPSLCFHCTYPFSTLYIHLCLCLLTSPFQLQGQRPCPCGSLLHSQHEDQESMLTFVG